MRDNEIQPSFLGTIAVFYILKVHTATSVAGISLPQSCFKHSINYPPLKSFSVTSQADRDQGKSRTNAAFKKMCCVEQCCTRFLSNCKSSTSVPRYLAVILHYTMKRPVSFLIIGFILFWDYELQIQERSGCCIISHMWKLGIAVLPSMLRNKSGSETWSHLALLLSEHVWSHCSV